MSQSRARALFQGGRWPSANHAELFDSPDACLAFMFGAPQHDAHVRARRVHLHLTAWQQSFPACDRAVAELVEQWRVNRELHLAAEAPATTAYLDKANRDFWERHERRKAECAALDGREKLHG